MTRGGKFLASGMRRRSSSSGEKEKKEGKPLGSASSGGPLRQRRKSDSSSRFERPKHLKPPALPGDTYLSPTLKSN